MRQRADVEAEQDRAEAAGLDVEPFDKVLDDVDEQLRARQGEARHANKRRSRSTRRRQDAPDLPRRKVEPRTVGWAFTAPDGKVFRPSMGITLTLPSYGRALPDGTPVDPASYDYRRAARDAIHFPKLIDPGGSRTPGASSATTCSTSPASNLRSGWPHLHMAMRGTMSRAELRKVTAATYVYVWWPKPEEPFYIHREPDWDPERGTYVDPDTREPLLTWNEARDALDDDLDGEPFHVVQFGLIRVRLS
jgi:hypothetical protein